MTQTLYFEPAWEKAISKSDRQFILATFEKQHFASGANLMSTYLQHAYNHRHQLLYTVLIHNFRNCAYLFKDKKVTLLDVKGSFISDTFTLPVKIPPRSSMPWTFIFLPMDKAMIEAEDAILLL